MGARKKYNEATVADIYMFIGRTINVHKMNESVLLSQLRILLR